MIRQALVIGGGVFTLFFLLSSMEKERVIPREILPVLVYPQDQYFIVLRVANEERREFEKIVAVAQAVQNIKGKPLLDTIEKEVDIKDPVTGLALANYLDLDCIKNLMARCIATQINNKPSRVAQLHKKLGNILPFNMPMQEAILAQIARFYHIMYAGDYRICETVISQKEYNFVFSIQDYIDYKWQFLHSRITDIAAFWELSLNSLEGMHEVSERIKEDSWGCVKQMYVNHNRLETIPHNIFKDFKNLTKLNLGDNKIETIEPGAFNGLHALTVLSLYDNCIERVEPSMWQGLSQLNQLILSSNRITTILPHAFPLPMLKYLNLSSNKITEIKEDMGSGLDNLEELRFEGNRTAIEEIDFTLFSTLKKLKKINLLYWMMPEIRKQELTQKIKAVNPHVKVEF